jgi:ArsR family transcriptional regulator
MLGLVLKEGELCVCDFVAALKVTQSKASRHLRHLVNAGLLQDRREAVWVYFRIAGAPEPAQTAALKMLPGVLTKRVPAELFTRLDQWRKRKECNGGSCKELIKGKTKERGGKR